MQSSTGQYSTHAGDPAQPVQHSVITASSFGLFLRAVLMPLERGSCFCSSGTIPGAFAASRSAAIVYILDRGFRNIRTPSEPDARERSFSSNVAATLRWPDATAPT